MDVHSSHLTTFCSLWEGEQLRNTDSNIFWTNIISELDRAKKTRVSEVTVLYTLGDLASIRITLQGNTLLLYLSRIFQVLEYLFFWHLFTFKYQVTRLIRAYMRCKRQNHIIYYLYFLLYIFSFSIERSQIVWSYTPTGNRQILGGSNTAQKIEMQYKAWLTVSKITYK